MKSFHIFKILMKLFPFQNMQENIMYNQRLITLQIKGKMVYF